MKYPCPACGSEAYDDVLGECPDCGPDATYEAPEPERCLYCGALVETPCDELPSGLCEKAMDAP